VPDATADVQEMLAASGMKFIPAMLTHHCRVHAPVSGASTLTEKPTLDIPLELRLLYSDLQPATKRPAADDSYVLRQQPKGG
jgi:hypothetical protein